MKGAGRWKCPWGGASSSNLVKYPEPPPAGGRVRRSLFAQGKGLPAGNEPDVRVTRQAQRFPRKLRKKKNHPCHCLIGRFKTPRACAESCWRSTSAARRANPARQRHLIYLAGAANNDPSSHPSLFYSCSDLGAIRVPLPHLWGKAALNVAAW